jgi:hypothetical protein
MRKAEFSNRRSSEREKERKAVIRQTSPSWERRNQKTLQFLSGELGRVCNRPFLSILEEVLGSLEQAGFLTDGSSASAPFPAFCQW